MMKLMHNRYYRRLLTSFVFMIAMPVLVLTAFSYNALVQRFEQTMRQESQLSLEASVSNLDQHLSQLQELSVTISADPLFYPNNLSQNSYRLLLAQKQFYRYFGANTFIYDSIFYLRNSKLMFSPSSTYHPNTFAETTYQFEDWDNSSFGMLLEQATDLTIHPMQKVNPISKDSVNLMTLMWQIPRISSKPYGTLMVSISEDDLASLFSIPYEKGAFLYIVNRIEEMPIGTICLPESWDACELPKALSNSAYAIQLNGRDYQLFEADSSISSLRIIAAIPHDVMLNGADTEVYLLLLLVGIIIVVGILLAVRFSRVNFHPLHQLSEMVKSAFPATVPEKAVNQLETTEVMLRELISREKLNSEAYKTHMVERLLKNRYDSIEMFNFHGKPFDFKLSCPSLRIGILKPDTEIPSLINKWREWLCYTVPNQPNIVYLTELPNGLLVTIINGTASESEIVQFHSAFMAAIADVFGCGVTMGVSQAYSDLSLSSAAYLQAVTALDMQTILGKHRTYFFTEAICETQFPAPSVDANLSRLQKQLLLYNKPQIQEEVDTICRYIQNSDSLFVARLQCFQTINLLLSQGRKLSLTSPLSLQDYDLFGVSAVLSTEELISILRRLSNEICSKLKTPMMSEDQLLDDMMAYLEANALNPDFSLKRMSDRFKTCDSNISRLFKQKTGQNISDIVANIRMAEAKRLLTETDYPIRDIVIKVGYIDVSSFSKKFKQLTHVSPSEYRKSLNRLPNNE